ncbi:MAG: hypothetical protein LQ347_002019 [Umbilicaria vellea]|nr:MAG: hypothetical protein LQ347_002019 [Umbilicaria vellea]
MKVTIFGLLALLSVGMSVAAPSPHPGKNGKDGPPGPPSYNMGKIKQQCSAKQSSISCCNSNGGGSGKGKSVFWPSGSNNQACDQITEGDNNKNVQDICSTTVACCIGDGCIAIAE